MKINNNSINSPEEISKSVSFIRMLIIYIVICGIGVSVLLLSFNSLIREQDKELTNDICSLVTEKMNSSISYMTGSVKNMAAGLSAQGHDDLSELYGILSQDNIGSGYVSMGFIDEEDKVYASATELEEFEKWGLFDVAKLADPVSISAPYRSGKTGQPVFTMFAHYTYGGGKRRYLFLTYPLKEIHKFSPKVLILKAIVVK